MTAIAAPGTAFQGLASFAKHDAFAANNGPSFAALLDDHMAPTPAGHIASTGANDRDGFAAFRQAQPNINPAPHRAELQAAGPGNLKMPASQLAVAGAIHAAIVATPLQNEPDLKNETPVAPVPYISGVPANFADASDPAPSNIPGVPVRKLPKLFTFNQLGMFGRHGAQFDAVAEMHNAAGNIAVLPPVSISAKDRPAIADSITQAPDSQNLPQSLSRGGSQALYAVPQLQGAGQQFDGSASPPEDVITAEEDMPIAAEQSGASNLPFVSLQSAISKPVPVPESAPLPEEEGGAPVLPPDIPENRTPSPLALVVSGSDNALTIIARSSDASAEPSTLRKLAESTAAEFGMHVTEVRINGSAVEPSFSPASGGNHGRRAR